MGEWTKGKLKPRGRFVDAAGTVDTWGGVVFSGIITCHKTRETDGDGRVWTASGNPEANAERIVACWNAMTGIEDPAAFMEEVRDEVRCTRSILDDLAHGRGLLAPIEVTIERLDALLEKMEGK